jgi:two-component system cell cycle sensor histidine kinase PleC
LPLQFTMTVASNFTHSAASPEKVANDDMAWHGEFLEIFLKNQMKLAPVMPLLVLFMAATATLWVPITTAAAWAVGAIGCAAVQVYLCKVYFSRARTIPEQRDWIGMIAASELFQGMFWVLPLFFFWPNSDSLQNTFLVAAIIAVSVVRLLIVSNFMPVLIAGTGVMTIGVAVRCVAEGNAIYLSLAGLVITLEVFYLFVARQLQDTLRDMIIYRQQKDALIQELKAERDRADAERQKAENANRAKSSFLAQMSHELRTPLNAILGFSEVMKGEMFGPHSSPQYAEYAGDIHSSGQHLLSLINEILDLSRIEAGRYRNARRAHEPHQRSAELPSTCSA